MKRTRALLLLGFLLMAYPASAQVTQFAGKWKNIDPETRGLSTMEIMPRGRNYDIQVWGKCHPSDCAWGHALGTIYTTGDACTESGPENSQVLFTIYVHSFAEGFLIIRPAANDRLNVELLTKFTDQSGRLNYRSVMSFARVVESSGPNNPGRRIPVSNVVQNR